MMVLLECVFSVRSFNKVGRKLRARYGWYGGSWDTPTGASYLVRVFIWLPEKLEEGKELDEKVSAAKKEIEEKVEVVVKELYDDGWLSERERWYEVEFLGNLFHSERRGKDREEKINAVLEEYKRIWSEIEDAR